MERSNRLATPLRLPSPVILLAAAAIVIAAVQWLTTYLRSTSRVTPQRAASREFAERFGLSIGPSPRI